MLFVSLNMIIKTSTILISFEFIQLEKLFTICIVSIYNQYSVTDYWATHNGLLATMQMTTG